MTLTPNDKQVIISYAANGGIMGCAACEDLNYAMTCACFALPGLERAYMQSSYHIAEEAIIKAHLQNYN